MGGQTAFAFLHPIQPLAHEGVAEHLLFDRHKMSGSIKHRERRSGIVVQQIPGVPVSTEVVLSCGQNECGATKEGRVGATSKEAGLPPAAALVGGVGELGLSASTSRTASTTVGLCTTTRSATGTKSARKPRVFYQAWPSLGDGPVRVCLHLGGAEQHAIDEAVTARDDATGQIPPIGIASEHEALTGRTVSRTPASPPASRRAWPAGPQPG